MNFATIRDYYILIVAGVAVFSILLDALIGDPHLKYHPVNGIGNAIQWFKRKLRTGHAGRDKVFGILLIIFVALIFGGLFFVFQVVLWGLLGIWNQNLEENIYWQYLFIVIFILIMGFWLKWTFAIRNLRDETVPIMRALERGDLAEARSRLSMIVRRDTTVLDDSHVISATVEVIAESCTDSITSVFWYYFKGCFVGVVCYRTFELLVPSGMWNPLWLFLGVPFAYLFRTINTADSIVGYKDAENLHIGWFSAKMDTISHVVTTPLTVLFFLVVGKIMGLDAKNGVKILQSDRKNTTSSNAGWTIGAMAGLLDVQLEKIAHYKLGNPQRALIPGDIRTTFRVVRIASILTITVLAVIFLTLIYFLI